MSISRCRCQCCEKHDGDLARALRFDQHFTGSFARLERYEVALLEISQMSRDLAELTAASVAKDALTLNTDSLAKADE